MQSIIEFDTVRVIALRSPAEQHLASSHAKRLPRVGDTGTVVHLLRDGDSDSRATRFIVESCENDGTWVWLAEFDRSEIELVSRPH